MKNLRRVLALAVVFAMVLSCVTALAVPQFEDVTDSEQAKVVGLLASLKIIQGYEDGTFKGDQTITRAEFAAVVDRALGMEDTAKSQTSTLFTDVPQSHWASGYVAAATGKNIIVGYGDGTFGPENPVKYEEAVKMLVVALGYEPQAADEGGYPTGHLFVAQRINLLYNANSYAGADANRMVVAQLVYNALDIPLMERSIWGGSTPVYEVMDGTSGTVRKTLMSEYLSLIKLAGVVTDNENTAGNNKMGLVSIKLTDNYSTKHKDDRRYKVPTDGTNNVVDYKVGDTAAKDFIGMSVIFFATYETNKSTDPTIKFIEEDQFTKAVIDIADIKTAEVSASNDTVKIVYYTDKSNGKTTNIFIPKAGIFFVNGVKLSDYTGEQLQKDITAGKFDGNGGADAPLSGNIEFVSTQSKGSADYDSIFINVYNNFVVGSVSQNTSKIVYGDSSPYAKSISFDPSDRDVLTTIVDEDGESIEPTSLVEGDILTLRMSHDNGPFPFNLSRTTSKSIYECTLVQSSIEGTVSETFAAGDYMVKIDNQEYDLDPAAVKADVLTLRNGDTGTFYLDSIGKIVAFDGAEASRGIYAVVLAATNTDGINTARIKLLTQDGKIVTKAVASRVRAVKEDAGTITTESLTSDKLIDKIRTNSFEKYGKVCLYKENGAGEINSMYFSAVDEEATIGGSKPYNKAANNAGRLVTNALDASGVDVRARSDVKYMRTNVGTYFFDEKTIILNIAKIPEDTDGNDDYTLISESDVNVYGYNSYGDDQKLDDATISVYNINDSSYAAFMLIKGEASAVDPTQGIALVRSTSSTNNADDEPVVKLSAYTSEGIISSYTLAFDCDEADSIQVGSAFTPVSFNSNNEVRTLRLLTNVDIDNNTVTATSTLKEKKVNKTDNITYYFGKVTASTNTTVTFTDEIKETIASETLNIRGIEIMVCDTRLDSKNCVKIGDLSEVEFNKGTSIPAPDDVSDYYVLIREQNGVIKDAVIYILGK